MNGGTHSHRASGFHAGRASLLHSIAVNAPFVQMNGRSSDIALACFYLTVPLLTLTIVLLSLIYTHQVVHQDGPFPDLPVSNPNNDTHAFYVALSSNFIVFVASWMSSLAPVLAGFAVGLAAYSVGQKILHDTRNARLENLPTPYQLSLTLRFINGSTWTGLWFWILYKLGWDQRNRNQAKPLTSVITVVAVTMFLGLAVFGADTWLHIATTTVSFVKVSDVTSQGYEYSLGLLSPNCTSTNNSIAALSAIGTTCGVDLGSGLFVDSKEPIRTLNDFSNTITVQDHDGSSLQYLDLASSVTNPSHDFSAISYGARTECSSLLQQCSLSRQGNVSFKCNNGSFAGALAVPNSGPMLQLLSYITEDLSVSALDPQGVENPFYTAVAALMIQPGNADYALASDPEIIKFNGGFAFVLFCSTTIFDVQYDVVNGSAVKVSETISNTTVTNAIAQPLINSQFGMSNLGTALDIGTQFAQTVQDLASTFASALTKVTLSAGVQAIARRPSEAVQQRDTILVARVPYGPLIALVIANLSFLILGLVLTFMALKTPSEAREVQTRFCITGLVADRFEERRARFGVPTLEHMFDEYQGHDSLRVGIDRSENGGYAFKTLRKDIDIEKFKSGDDWHEVNLKPVAREGWI